MEKKAFREGLKDGIPVGLGYFVVSFALGITAGSIGLNWFQALIFSLFNLASAGEKAALEVMKYNRTYAEMALMILIVNSRYLLMSTALSQKIDPKMKNIHRFTLSAFVTDELFGLNISRKGSLCPSYFYGTYLTSGPLWAVGTALGVVAGNILPPNIVSALSVAIFGMFIAIIIPPAKKDKVVAMLVLISFALSYGTDFIPYDKAKFSSLKIIILTVIIAGAAAILFPVKDEDAPSDTAEKEGEANAE